MSSVEEASLRQWEAELRVLLQQVKFSQERGTGKQSDETKEELRNILQQLLVLVSSVQQLNPKEKKKIGTTKPKRIDNFVDMPRPPGMGDPHECLLCKAYMSNIVFVPCFHCVICSHCWKLHYTDHFLPNGDPSTSAKKPWRGCPAVACRKKDIKVQSCLSLKYTKQTGKERNVRYDQTVGQKNEYLGDSAVLEIQEHYDESVGQKNEYLGDSAALV